MDQKIDDLLRHLEKKQGVRKKTVIVKSKKNVPTDRAAKLLSWELMKNYQVSRYKNKTDTH